MPDGRPKNFVFGSDPHDEVGAPILRELAQEAGLDLSERVTSVKDYSLEHLLFFYRELRGIPINAMDSFQTMKSVLNDSARRGHDHWTHREGDQYFSAQRFRDIDTIRRQMTAALEIFPELVFEPIGEGRHKYVTQSADGSRLPIYPDKPDAPSTLAGIPGGARRFELKILEALKKLASVEEFEQRLAKRQKDLEDEMENLPPDPRSKERYDRLKAIHGHLGAFNATERVKVFGPPKRDETEALAH